LTKAGVFDQKQLKKSYHSEKLTIDFIKTIARKHAVHSVLLSAVKPVSARVIEYLNKNFRLIELNEFTPIPITNKYKSPATLGKDRLAGVVGAAAIYKRENVLVIDAGTCITFDFINKKNEYFGGSISPGIQMRFKALHTFTGKLPLVSLTNFKGMAGTNTNESILAGVINGAAGETDTVINY
jgi:type III pantothenate kinase